MGALPTPADHYLLTCRLLEQVDKVIAQVKTTTGTEGYIPVEAAETIQQAVTNLFTRAAIHATLTTTPAGVVADAQARAQGAPTRAPLVPPGPSEEMDAAWRRDVESFRDIIRRGEHTADPGDQSALADQAGDVAVEIAMGLLARIPDPAEHRRGAAEHLPPTPGQEQR